MRRLALAALLLLAACGGEQWVKLTPDEQQRLAAPGIRVNAIVTEGAPVVTRLLATTEAEVLASGRPLDVPELALARSLGVREPERVRVALRDRFPMPADPRFAALSTEMGFIFGTEAEIGRTQGHAILLKPGAAGAREVLAHELVHVAQYERLGGIEAYTREYMTEVLALGYQRAPLEQEAYARQSGVR